MWEVAEKAEHRPSSPTTLLQIPGVPESSPTIGPMQTSVQHERALPMDISFLLIDETYKDFDEENVKEIHVAEVEVTTQKMSTIKGNNISSLCLVFIGNFKFNIISFRGAAGGDEVSFHV